MSRNNYHLITDPKDPRYPIVRPMYLVSIPEAFVNGRRYSYGDRRVDNLTLGNLAKVRLPIATLAEHFANGARISVVMRKDVVKIYNDTQRYLLHWIEYVKHGPLNRAEMPTDDLILLDNFANSIYEPAAFDAAIEPENVVNFQSMISNDFMIEQLTKNTVDAKRVKIKPRDSLENDIYKYSSDLSGKFEEETMIPFSEFL